ncbi:hypothetical protein V6N13_021235 [Hibiscus sabdariffa]
MAAKEARYDKEGLMRFFRMLIKRWYFPDDLSTSNTWSISPPRTSQRLDENSGDDHQLYKRTSLSGRPLQVQHASSLTGAAQSDSASHTLPSTAGFSNREFQPPTILLYRLQEINSSARSKRADINV